MFKATIKKNEITMTAEGTPLTLMAEACVFIETLINDIARSSPDEQKCQKILWDMYLSTLKGHHP